MKYRTKLILMFTALAVVTNGVLMAVTYFNLQRLTFQEIQSKALTIAATAGALIDAEPHKEIHSAGDENKPEYETLYKQLKAVRDANRREDLKVKFAYTFIRPGGPDSPWVFGVDAEEAGSEDKSMPGDEYEGDFEDWNINDYHVDNRYTSDKWGTWLSSAAPLKDKGGNTVATLGIDLEATGVQQKVNRILFYGLGSLAISLLFAVGVSIYLSNLVSKPLYQIQSTVEIIGSGNLKASVNLTTRDEFGKVAEAINNMVAGLRERELLKHSLEGYVSSQISDSILQTGQLPSLVGERAKITAMFCDIRNFTKITESMDAEDVVGILNEFFENLIETIFDHKGMVNKYLGDGMLAIFGAPAKDAEQEENALKAARDIQEKVCKMNARLEKEKGIQFRVGVGISTGEAIVGNIGACRRYEYTAIGDVVNLTSRLESETKNLKENILLAECSAVPLIERYPLRRLGVIAIRGREEPVAVYAL